MKLKLFPLSLVAFPSKLIPLHIFEDRYKRMISSCIDEKKDFGIIYQNTKTQSKIGCSVSVEKIINKYPDGRMDILVRGRKIFKVQKQAFLGDLAIGDITFMPDLKPLDKDIFNPLLDKYMKLMLAAGFKDNLDHHLSKTLTFELLEMIQTSHHFELELLRLDSEKKRAGFLDQFFSSILKQSKLFNSDRGYQS
tara:strand:- start:24185 stop:24766 length:582 start_codon:yes stop_codon:yes gene_type:complete